jgi:hypothetical protein
VLQPTRAALLRFARVLERRGDPAGDAFVRASAAKPPFTGDEQEASLRQLIDALDRHGEHDVLDALRPEVEKSYRVGHLYARALGRRGALDALNSYVRAQAHCWEHCTRLDGALASLVQRGSEGARLIRGWLTLPRYGANAEADRAHLWAQSRLAQALVWLGDEASTRPVLTLLEGEVAKGSQFDSMTGKLELAPLCAAMGEVPRATALLRDANADWDAIFDEDIDGYGRLPRDALNRAAQRVQHLEAQGRLPLEARTWDEPAVKRPYIPMWSSNFWRRHNAYDLDELLTAGNFDGALDFLSTPREGGEWATLIRTTAESLSAPTPEQTRRLLEVHRRLPSEGKSAVSWSAWCAASVCGALARGDRADDAFAIAAAIRDANLTERPLAELACAEAIIARRGSHPAVRPAIDSAMEALRPHLADSQTDLFTTPYSFAELLRPLS